MRARTRRACYPTCSCAAACLRDALLICQVAGLRGRVTLSTGATQVTGVPHSQFFSRGRKLGEMRGDSESEFRKLMVKYQQQHTFSGAGYTLGSRSGGGSAPPTAMGASREANADALQRRADVAAQRAPPPADKVNSLMNMGFPRGKAIAALQRTEDNVDQAADILLGGGSAQDKAWMAGGAMEEDEEVARRNRQAGAGAGAAGAKCGIGLGLADHWDNTGPRVSDIVPYSPAAEAKVFTKGDKVVSVDGIDVRGKRVEMIKEMILGVPGSPIEIGFIPAQAASSWSLGTWGSSGGQANKDVVRVSLRREVRVQTAAATARDRAPAPEEKPQSTAWYTTVSQDIKSGFQRLTKNIETSLVSAGDSLGEAGSAVGTTAKAGYDSTSAGASKVAEATKESTAVAGGAIAEAGSKVKEAIGVDAAARARMAELEEENMRLKAQLAAATDSPQVFDEVGAARGGTGAEAVLVNGNGRGSVGGTQSSGFSITNYEVEDAESGEGAGADVEVTDGRRHGGPSALSPGENGWKVREQSDALEHGGGGALGDRAGGLVTPNGRVGNVVASCNGAAGGRAGGAAAAARAGGSAKSDRKELSAQKEMGEARSFTREEFVTAKSPNLPQCHIRVRMTDGTSMEKMFPSKSKVQEVLESALPTEDLRREWTLMMAYPRKVFGDDELQQTLAEASLVPAATLTVTRKPLCS